MFFFYYTDDSTRKVFMQIEVIETLQLWVVNLNVIEMPDSQEHCVRIV